MSPVCFLKRELNSKKRRPYGWHFITRDYSPVVPVCKRPINNVLYLRNEEDSPSLFVFNL